MTSAKTRPMKTWVKVWLFAASCVVGLLNAAGGAHSQSVETVVLRLSRGAIVTPETPMGAMVSECTFNSTSLQLELQAAGIVALTAMFPEFDGNALNTTNTAGEPITLLDLSTFYVAELAPGASPDSAVSQLAGVQDVIGVALQRTGKPLQTSCGPPQVTAHLGSQWWLRNEGTMACGAIASTPDTDINAYEAWGVTKGCENPVRVGVLDSGIDGTNPEFTGRLEAGPDFSGSVFGFSVLDDVGGHGTPVAGIIGANGADNFNVAGVNWGARLVSIRLFEAGDGLVLWLPQKSAQAIEWASSHGVRIMNCSYGSDLPTGFGEVLGQDGEFNAATNAFLRGHLIVAGAGNEFSDESPPSPAMFDKPVLAVGALTADGVPWREPPVLGLPSQVGSSYGNYLDIAAPGGRHIATTKAGSPWVKDCINGFGGTSASAPVVAGVASLVLSKYSHLLGEDLTQVLTRTARDVEGGGIPDEWDVYTGAGLVRADAALAFLAHPRKLLHVRATGLSQVAQSSIEMPVQNVPGFGTTMAYGTRYRMRGYVSFGTEFASIVATWDRASGSAGTRPKTDNALYSFERDMYGGTIVPGTLTATGCEVETDVYYLVNARGEGMWFPTTRENAAVALTVVGAFAPLTIDIDGDTGLGFKVTGTWTAGVEGGDGEYEYEWRWRSGSAGPWSGVQSTAASYQRMMLNSSFEVQLTVRSFGFESTTVQSVQFVGDTDPPRQVTNLTAANVNSSQIGLSWTHPPENDGGTSVCEEYDLRYAPAPITAGTFGSATRVSPQPTPGTVGSAASYTFSGRDPCSTYYWALKAKDEVDNWSSMSNVATVGPTAQSGCSGDGGEEDPPIVHHTNRAGQGQSAYRLSGGHMLFRVYLAPGQSPISLEVFDVRGRLRQTVARQEGQAGWQEFQWRMDDKGGNRVAPGIYFVTLRVPGVERRDKIVLLP